MKKSLLNTSGLNQHIRYEPEALNGHSPQDDNFTVYELSFDDLYACDADWDSIKHLLVERGASAKKLDAGEFEASEIGSDQGLRVVIQNG